MKDIKVYLKIIRYGLQFKLMCILGAIFLGLGILFELSSFGNNSLGCIYLAIAGLYVFQLIFTPTIAKFVQTSPYKRKVQTCGSAFVSTIFCLLTFTVLVVLRLVRATPENMEKANTDLVHHYSIILSCAIVAAFLLFYMAFCFKMYIVALIICISFVLGMMFFGMNSQSSIFVDITKVLTPNGNPVPLILCSYGIILLGGFLCYISNILLYKREMSNLAIKNAMRQAGAK